MTPEGDPVRTSFSVILRYVLGFMATMALLAFSAVWLVRHC
jgi:hypothetical protein